MSIEIVMISFFVYAFFGWIWESFVYPLVSKRKIANSGFLNGPVVPIYGVGAISMLLLLSSVESDIVIFISGAIIATVIEYITSWVMEKVYHRRWWDYSDRHFHIQGRVCLAGALLFGGFGLLVVKVIQPFFNQYLMRYDQRVLLVIVVICSVIFIIDFLITVIYLTMFRERVDDFIIEIEDYFQKVRDEAEHSRLNASELLENMQIKDFIAYASSLKKKKYIEKRILKAFPDLIKKKK